MREDPGSQLAFLQNYRSRGAWVGNRPTGKGGPAAAGSRGVTATRPIQSHLRQNATPDPPGDREAAGARRPQPVRTFEAVFLGDDLENVLRLLEQDSRHAHVGGALGLGDCEGQRSYRLGAL